MTNPSSEPTKIAVVVIRASTSHASVLARALRIRGHAPTQLFGLTDKPRPRSPLRSGYRQACAAEHPGAADLVGDALDGRTLGPIKHGHGRPPSFQLTEVASAVTRVHAARRSPSICLSQAASGFQLANVRVTTQSKTQRFLIFTLRLSLTMSSGGVILRSSGRCSSSTPPLAATACGPRFRPTTRRPQSDAHPHNEPMALVAFIATTLPAA